ncbi:MAG TPA: sulfatase-like hydrolase/transferase [Planctomycetota bacterium]|nr:sulfatase-like hydrolase/transferase [Planctomycetota bacterium]
MLTWLLLAAAPSPAALPAPVQAFPGGNVLILLADDLGTDKLDCYGNPAAQFKPHTPAISALAASGVLFRNAYSEPVCSPTRAAILTGRYGFRNGIGHIVVEGKPEFGPLSLSEVTLPEMLAMAGAGYASAAIGKWHLGTSAVGGDCAPILAGFGHWAGVPENLFTVQEYMVWPKVAHAGLGACASAPPAFGLGCMPPLSPTYATTETVNEALDWIAAQTEPWVCYVAFNTPHSPLHKPPDDLLYTPNPPPNPYPMHESPAPYLAAMIEALDKEIGRLLACMPPAQRAQTTVIFLGDNGTESGSTVDGVSYPLVFPPYDPKKAKATLYQLGVNVPFIVSGKAVKQPGRESDALVDVTDIFATVADIAGVDLGALGFGCGGGNRALDGVSFLPILESPSAPSQRTFAFSERFEPNFDSGLPDRPIEQARERMIRNARFKLIVQARRPINNLWGSVDLVPIERFFDLQSDPLEDQDLLKLPPSSWPPEAAPALASLRHELAQLLTSCQ